MARPQSPVDGVYRAQRARLRSTVTALTAGIWATGVHQEPQTIRDVLRVVYAGQAQTVALVDAYMAIKADTQPQGLDSSKYTVDTIRGVAADELYRRPWGALGGQIAGGAKLADAMGSARASLARLVTTDLQLSQTYSARDWMTSDGNVIGYERVAGGSACALCEAASQGVYHSEDLMPIHEHCVVGETLVAGVASAEAVTRRWYRGEIIVLRTASGDQLTVTPNHPILTPQGWVAAGLLDEGAHVVSSRAGHRPVGGVPDEREVPASIEDRFAAGRVGGLVHVPFASEDFHGDGGNGEVDVVAADGALRDRTEIREPCSHLEFPGRIPAAVAFPGDSEFGQVLLGAASAAPRRMGRARKRGSLSLGELCHPHQTSVMVASALDASFVKCAIYDATRHAERLAEGQDALACEIAPYDRAAVQRDLPGSHFDPALTQVAKEGRLADAGGGRALVRMLASEIKLDRLVDLRRVEASCHVYNLRTRAGFYFANGIVTHNCSCDVVPVIGGDHSPVSLDVRVVDEPGFGPRLLADDWAA